MLWRREQLPTPVFWPGEFHGLYSPRGHKESNMTEWLSLWWLSGKESACNMGDLGLLPGLGRFSGEGSGYLLQLPTSVFWPGKSMDCIVHGVAKNQTWLYSLFLCVCVYVCVCVFPPVILPSEIPKLCTDMPMRGFPIVWKLLLLHNSLPGTGLHP